MKTGYKVTTDLADSSWYYLDNFGVVQGPVIFANFRELVINGVVDVSTKISQDKEHWHHAGVVAAIGFDCIVMAADETCQLYGPFATDFIEKPELSAGIPGDGSLFVRIGSVNEVVSSGGISATIGENKEELESLLQEKSDLASALAALQTSSEQELFRLSAENEALVQEKSSLSSDLATLQASSEQELSRLSAENEALLQEKSSLASDFATLQASSAQELSRLSAENEALAQEKSSLSSDLATLQVTLEQQKLDFVTENTEKIELKSIVEAQIESNKKLELNHLQKIEGLNSEVSRLNEQIKTLQGAFNQEKKKLADDLREAQNDYVKAQIRVKHAEAACGVAETQAMRIPSLEKEINALTLENQNLLNQKHELSDLISEMKKHFEEERQRWLSATGKRNSSESKHSCLEGEIVEDVEIISSNGDNDEMFEDIAENSPGNVEFSDKNQTIIAFDNQDDVSEDRTAKAEQVFNLEAQLQKELMQLGAKHGRQVFDFDRECNSSTSKTKGSSGLKKLFFKK